MFYTKKILSKFALISGSFILCSNKHIYNSQQPVLSEILRGQYQNKIRRYSPPEKIFDVFATIRQNGQVYMNLNDLLKAICFYNYSVSDQSQIQGFQADSIIGLLGKTDKFQIYDYFILVRFLAFERKKIQKYFQDNKIGTMDMNAFKKFLLQNVCQDYNQYIIPSIGLQSRNFKPNQKKYQQSIDQTVNSLFKKYPKGLNLNSLIQFRRKMIQQLFGFQFLLFKHNEENKIDGTDFARSIIKYVNSSKKKKFMKRIKKFNDEFQQIKIAKESYIAFHFYIQTNIDELQKQLNKQGAFNSDQVYELINKFVPKQRYVSRDQTDILIKVLDLDDSGFIEKKQFLGVLQNLQYYTQVKSGQLTFTQILQKDFDIIKDKAKRILQILEE